MYNKPTAGRISRHLKHAVKFSYPLTRTTLLWASHERVGLNTGGQNIKGKFLLLCLTICKISLFLITFNAILFCDLLSNLFCSCEMESTRKTKVDSDWNKVAEDKNQWQPL